VILIDLLLLLNHPISHKASHKANHRNVLLGTRVGPLNKVLLHKVLLHKVLLHKYPQDKIVKIPQSFVRGAFLRSFSTESPLRPRT
jgi:hypothetical protein